MMLAFNPCVKVFKTFYYYISNNYAKITKHIPFVVVLYLLHCILFKPYVHLVFLNCIE